MPSTDELKASRRSIWNCALSSNRRGLDTLVRSLDKDNLEKVMGAGTAVIDAVQMEIERRAGFDDPRSMKAANGMCSMCWGQEDVYVTGQKDRLPCPICHP